MSIKAFIINNETTWKARIGRCVLRPTNRRNWGQTGSEDPVSFCCSRSCHCTTFSSSSSHTWQCADGLGRSLCVCIHGVGRIACVCRWGVQRGGRRIEACWWRRRRGRDQPWRGRDQPWLPSGPWTLSRSVSVSCFVSSWLCLTYTCVWKPRKFACLSCSGWIARMRTMSRSLRWGKRSLGLRSICLKGLTFDSMNLFVGSHGLVSLNFMNFTSFHLISRSLVKNNSINFHFTSTVEKWGNLSFLFLLFEALHFISCHFISRTFLMKWHPWRCVYVCHGFYYD